MVSLTLSIFAHFLPIFASKLHPAPSHPSNLIVQTYLHLILFTLQPIYNSYSRHLVLRDQPFDTLAYFTPQPFYNSPHFTLRGFDIPSLHQFLCDAHVERGERCVQQMTLRINQCSLLKGVCHEIFNLQFFS